MNQTRWWNVTKYIYSSIVLQFWHTGTLLEYFHCLLLYTSTPLKGNIVLFTLISLGTFYIKNKRAYMIRCSTALLLYPVLHKVSKIGSTLRNIKILVHVFIRDKKQNNILSYNNMTLWKEPLHEEYFYF